MPRGVAIPEIRPQLFAAVERLIAGEGPGRLTGRAVTREAGVATGLLHAHFGSFDDFLAAYAIDRAFHVAGGVAGLPGRAGTATVAGNLTEAVLATPLETLMASTRLMASRPELAAKVEAVLGAAGLAGAERSIADYLAAEQRLGRVPAGADPAALALAVVGVLHHVALTDGDSTRIRRAVDALAGVLVAES